MVARAPRLSRDTESPDPVDHASVDIAEDRVVRSVAGSREMGVAGEAPSGIARYVALLGSIRPYERAWLSRDVIAGVTLAALAIPEVMGYTKIAGTPVITGLYTMLLPVCAFAVLGSSRHLVVGADSATAAIMYAGIGSLGIAGLQPGTSDWLALASVSALLAAGLLFLARLARLGFISNFISRTVLIGFLSGVGIQVALGQLGGMLGVPAPHVSPGRGSGSVITFWETLKDIGQSSGSTLAVSLAVLATLLVCGRWLRVVPGGLVAVVGAIAVSWAADLSSHGVAILGAVPSGLPHVGFPSGVTWTDVSRLLPTSAAMFLVILAQSAATSRAYAVKYQERFVENDDLLGLTAANLTAGLSGTFVVNGSPTKTEMVDEAGSHTQVAQLTTAAIVVVVLLFLTKPLQYLPNAALAAIVFLIGLKLVDLASMRRIWRLRRDEFWVAVATAAVVIGIGVEQGIILAIVLSLVSHIKRHYTPRSRVVRLDAAGRFTLSRPTPGTVSEPGIVVYRFGAGLFYANAERLSEEALGLVETPDPPRWFVLHAGAMDDIDFTGGATLCELADQLADRSVVFAVADASPAIRRELDLFGITDKIGSDNYYDSVKAALEAFHAA
jgi:high affinity sulfate transporter 1